MASSRSSLLASFPFQHPPPLLRSLLLPIIALLLNATPSTLLLTNAQCFMPDGTPANNTPCYLDLPDSFCCGAGYTCMSIKACQGPTTPDQSWYTRGSCTSSDWANAACPTFCKEANTGFLTDIFECPDGKWCCQRED